MPQYTRVVKLTESEKGRIRDGINAFTSAENYAEKKIAMENSFSYIEQLLLKTHEEAITINEQE